MASIAEGADDARRAAETREPSGAPRIMAHGGAGTPADRSAEVEAAARAAWEALERGRPALESALAAAVALEDDPRFNAGTGSNIRMDGETVQMDAACMNESGDFGAVAVIERVKNPVLVARAVMESPHLLMAGEGAERFARTLGMPEYDPRTPESRNRYRALRARMKQDSLGEEWRDFDWKKHWNFPKALDPALAPNDTIGAVASDGKGGYAAAITTGGGSTTLMGRVGDVPIMGAGCYAGPKGAVCTTGWGEYIIREQLSLRVYNWMAEGIAPADAVARGVALYPKEISVGIIAVSEKGMAAASNTSMAWAGIEENGVRRADRPSSQPR